MLTHFHVDLKSNDDVAPVETPWSPHDSSGLPTLTSTRPSRRVVPPTCAKRNVRVLLVVLEAWRGGWHEKKSRQKVRGLFVILRDGVVGNRGEAGDATGCCLSGLG